MAFDKRLFLILFISIFFSTIAGILFHEFGHWIAYRYYGYKTRIGYAYTGWMANDAKRNHHLIELEYANKIDSNLDFPLKQQYETLGKQIRKESIVIGAAGPILTILATAVAVILLFFQRKKRDTDVRLTFQQWLLVLISLFCIRNIRLFHITTSDEFKLAKILGINAWGLLIIIGMPALTVVGWLIFYIIPQKQRITFVTAFIAGEIAVWILWIQLLGPRLLP